MQTVQLTEKFQTVRRATRTPRRYSSSELTSAVTMILKLRRGEGQPAPKPSDSRLINTTVRPPLDVVADRLLDVLAA
jgi:hypothetical protein